MERRWTWLAALVLATSLAPVSDRAWAVITRLTPLREVLAGEQFIFVAKVEKVDPDRPGLVLQVQEDLKGKVPFRRLAVNLTGDSEGQREQHGAKLRKRLVAELPLVVFTSARGKRYTAFAYTNGTWFQMIGQPGEGPDSVRWSLTHCEPYLRRTFKGPTAELRQVIVDGLAGTRPPPEPDPKEPPGLGPELGAEKGRQGDKETRRQGDPQARRLRVMILGWAGGGVGPVLGVIPTFVLVGPLALLAALFPAVFGGLALWFRRWLVLLSVASLDSTLYLLHTWFRGALRDSWWGSPTALWGTMALVTLAGAAWSARRHRSAVRAGQTDPMAPRRSDEIVLGVLSVVGLGAVAYSLLRGVFLQPPWKELLVVWAVAWAGGIYLLYLRARARDGAPPGRRPAPERVMLWALAFACLGIGATALPPRAARLAWTFEAPERGTISSSPLVADGRVYAAAAHSSGLTPFGALYCLDAATGRLLWSFDDDQAMKQVFSSPCLAAGRLYVGEGFHQDSDCKLYCLDAATGRKLWDFATKSHTESSPRVEAGKVYFGAGDDGVFCLDAVTGKGVWHFTGPHVDTTPALAGNRLYGGSGYGSYEIFSLDTETGKSVWRVPTDLPVFAAPVVAGDEVFFGAGNGDLLKSADRPAGALLCVEAATGRQRWRCDLADAVHARPAVTPDAVVVGCRDHRVYCFERSDARLRWAQDLGSAVVAAPVLVGPQVYAVASGGRVGCLDVPDGRVAWTFDVAGQSQANPELLSGPAVSLGAGGGDQRRRIYFGAGLKDLLSSTAAVYCLEDQ